MVGARVTVENAVDLGEIVPVTDTHTQKFLQVEKPIKLFVLATSVDPLLKSLFAANQGKETKIRQILHATCSNKDRNDGKDADLSFGIDFVGRRGFHRPRLAVDQW